MRSIIHIQAVGSSHDWYQSVDLELGTALCLCRPVDHRVWCCTTAFGTIPVHRLNDTHCSDTQVAPIANSPPLNEHKRFRVERGATKHKNGVTQTGS